MSSRELYKRFISLCQKWPKDEQKVGRDYAEHFREQLSAHFPHGESSTVKDPKIVEEYLTSLEKIANNIYYNEKPLKRSSASGMELWVCRNAVSNEGLRLIQEQEESTLIGRLKQSLGIKYKKDMEQKKSGQEKVENIDDK